MDEEKYEKMSKYCDIWESCSSLKKKKMKILIRIGKNLSEETVAGVSRFFGRVAVHGSIRTSAEDKGACGSR